MTGACWPCSLLGVVVVNALLASMVALEVVMCKKVFLSFDSAVDLALTLVVSRRLR